MSKPIVQALVLADQVYQDKKTNKFIIAGTFNRYHLRKKPSQGETAESPPDVDAAAGGLRKMELSQVWSVGSPFAYINLTNVRGQVPFELRYVDLHDYLVLLSLSFAIPAKDPLDSVEICARLPVLPAPHPGVYALELLTDNEVLGSYRVTIVGETANQGEENQ